MTDNTIFIFGVFVTILLFGGVVLNFIEFRKMEKHPERYGRLRSANNDSKTTKNFVESENISVP